ncbi:hypothetical protein [Dictyobacter aurantiacus]|uniref:Uncharacterized protein n=1 Tax=Dictyobacter aurantiacus TaxID=1936993 RepID=A0A401ZSJ8_9CHLR|nr:hypothetical protein [Dictyobacter aurantiacus]GCE09776.1 hypothetical protein KDAU_71050 [Dictyobacter aurantiacus]
MNMMKRTGAGGSLRRPPIWLVVLLTLGLIVRLGWLAFVQDRLNGSLWSGGLLPLLLSVLSILLTWHIAASLTRYAELSERGAERFTVMSTLLMVAPPLAILTLQLSSWLSSASTLVLLMLLALLQRWQQSRRSVPTWQHPIPRRLYRLTSLPLFCATLVALLYAGFYVLPVFPHTSGLIIITDLFALGWPYTIGAFFTLPYLITQYRQERTLLHNRQISDPGTSATVVFHVAVLILIGTYFIIQLYIYFLIP